jgi:hypothetical protein
MSQDPLAGLPDRMTRVEEGLISVRERIAAQESCSRETLQTLAEIRSEQAAQTQLLKDTVERDGAVRTRLEAATTDLAEKVVLFSHALGGLSVGQKFMFGLMTALIGAVLYHLAKSG